MSRIGKRARRLKNLLIRSGRVFGWAVRLLVVLVVVDVFYLAAIWPDWKGLAGGPVSKSRFMLEYEQRRAEDKSLPGLRWQPVPLAVVPKHLIRAVILAEDSRFYEHGGFDLQAFREAMEHNLVEGKFRFGASTISQQTVKNLLLTPSRNPLRKWHELALTWGMEHHLKKRRILEIYLNVAEFGQGLYGAQAAAQAYYGVGVSNLTPSQAAELAATLPSPLKHNPANRTDVFERRAAKILSLLLRYPGEAADALNALGVESLGAPVEERPRRAGPR